MGNTIPIAIMYNTHINHKETKNEINKNQKQQNQNKKHKTIQSSTYKSVSLIDSDDEKV
tara:strand:+ start:566 stop:742 length:177 start_codon:yes stop_codon:yes gene_type:complete